MEKFHWLHHRIMLSVRKDSWKGFVFRLYEDTLGVGRVIYEMFVVVCSNMQCVSLKVVAAAIAFSLVAWGIMFLTVLEITILCAQEHMRVCVENAKNTARRVKSNPVEVLRGLANALPKNV